MLGSVLYVQTVSPNLHIVGHPERTIIGLLVGLVGVVCVIAVARIGWEPPDFLLRAMQRASERREAQQRALARQLNQEQDISIQSNVQEEPFHQITLSRQHDLMGFRGEAQLRRVIIITIVLIVLLLLLKQIVFTSILETTYFIVIGVCVFSGLLYCLLWLIHVLRVIKRRFGSSD